MYPTEILELSRILYYINRMNILDYDLPDSFLIKKNDYRYHTLFWVPQTTAIIIGKSNKPLDSIHEAEVTNDHVPVYQRPSGGMAVIISPGTLIISIGYKTPTQKRSSFYFAHYNNKIMQALETLGVEGLKFEGISDITLKGKKILGCSIYRNKHKVFYHAVLNLVYRLLQ